MNSPPVGGTDDAQGTEAGKKIIKTRLRLVINEIMAGKEKTTISIKITTKNNNYEQRTTHYCRS